MLDGFTTRRARWLLVGGLAVMTLGAVLDAARAPSLGRVLLGAGLVVCLAAGVSWARRGA